MTPTEIFMGSPISLDLSGGIKPIELEQKRNWICLSPLQLILEIDILNVIVNSLFPLLRPCLHIRFISPFCEHKSTRAI